MAFPHLRWAVALLTLLLLFPGGWTAGAEGGERVAILKVTGLR